MIQISQSFSPISIDAAYALLYGHAAAPDVLDLLHNLLGRDSVEELSDFRKIIMRLDRQSHPTPAIVRFGINNLQQIEVEGFRFYIDSDDIAVSTTMLNQGRYEAHLTGVFRRYIKPGWRVVDIGANVGYFTMLAASLVGAGGEVLAFDPNSENARLILLNAAENRYSNIRLFPLALSDYTGHAYFSSHLGSNGGLMVNEQAQLADGMGLVVPTARLDDLVQGPVDFIKIDTEGAEYRILRGSQKLLSSARPIISSEFSCEMISRVSSVAPRDYLALFLQYGYSIFMIDKGSGCLEPIGDIDSFLGAWGSLGRIEDLVMLPTGAQVLQPQSA